MRRRILTTTKILVATLATGPGCSRPARPEPPPASSEPTTASASAPPPSASAEKPEDPKLVLLRAELSTANRADVAANPTRFQPLCDQDGYPLVGNLSRKGPGQTFDVSQFCADVRKTKAR